MDVVGLFWPLVGALIGVAAAQRRGFSVAAGVIGGLLLGPLAVFMFFVSGVTSSDRTKKCPFCAEWIRDEAIVCRHCGKSLTAECPDCEAQNPSQAKFCTGCGKELLGA